LTLDALRHRHVLTDVSLLVGGRPLLAHKAVLAACSSGFFYSIFLGQGGSEVSVLNLPSSIQPGGFQALLDFMYTSRLSLTPASVPALLSAATYLQMEHVVATCHRFIQASPGQGLAGSGKWGMGQWPVSFRGRRLPPSHRVGLTASGGGAQRLPPSFHPLSCSYDHTNFYPMSLSSLEDPKLLDDSRGPPDVGGMVPMGGPHPVGQSPETPLHSAPAGSQAKDLGGAHPRGERPPDSPSRSEGHPASPRESSGCAPDPKACNWKKYKFIVLNSLRGQGVGGGGREGRAGPQPPDPPTPPKPPAGRDQGTSCGEVEGDVSGSQHNSNLCKDAHSNIKERSAQSHIPGHTPPHYSAPCAMRPGPCCTHPVPTFPSSSCSLQQERFGPICSAGPYSCRACKLALGDDEEEEGGLCGEQAPVGISHDNKPFKCQLCHSAFRYKGNLASHRAVHTGEKPYRCGLCGAQFNRPANLKTHSRIHSGEKPYKCETCGSSFVQVAHLRAHVLIHTGEKPYPCETCGTRFRHLQTLKSHIRIHTGEKPYHCETCHLHFRHKSQLRLHLRQKHGAITNTKIRYTVRGPCCLPSAPGTRERERERETHTHTQLHCPPPLLLTSLVPAGGTVPG
uniref:BCL6B transcription repressor n=1 Tax=Pelodiscus sinensis TaxID=13735 RepID=K7G2Z0_PELSI